MPLWLQVAGAIASAVLSYFGRYDDSHVQEMIKDVAYNLNLALQRLNEISIQIARLVQAVEELPEEIAANDYRAALQRLNTEVLASTIRYEQLLKTNPKTSLFVEQIKEIYNNVVEARTNLQVLSLAGNVQFAPLAASIVPVSLVLELGLLYRLGREGRELRRATQENYHRWFDFLLDPTEPNSVAANVNSGVPALAASDGRVNGGILSIALTNPSTPQAVYGLEHQIGRSIRSPFFPDKSMAQLLNETWIRFYGVLTATSSTVNGERIWDIGAISESFQVEQYAKGANGNWYTPVPKWTINLDTYDSGDLQRFRGQNHAQRVADIMNSPKWRNFLTEILPASVAELGENNRIRAELKFASDVLAALQAAGRIFELNAQGTLAIEEAA
ncbi:hypothetical protein [Mesorhizobium sp.]|uniref:hypothetical protein n=1 Tax=Mesorhizobium sp. TaxID=1871066 RepID=UPI000FE87C3F|nr:hypothetical protein [Mesorhizobium sp.]RWE96487.1 MAG: hypothetical protein EOS43_22565 [Mesorhizobium sp.]